MRACSRSTPDARDTTHLRIALWNAPPAPGVRGRRPTVRASKSGNTLARCGLWQQVIRFPKPQRSQGAGSPTPWQPGTPAMAGGMMDSVWTMEALLARPARSVSDQRHCVTLSSTLSRDTTLNQVECVILSGRRGDQGPLFPSPDL
jgi:hypothetical protein